MQNITAHIQLLICNLIWACGYPLYNFVMPKYIEPIPLFTATTIVTALLSLTSLAWRTEETPRVERRDMFAIVGAALLIALLRKGMLIVGLSMTSPIDGSIISSIGPVVVLVISVAMRLERFSPRKAIGILLGLGGALGVILSGGGTAHQTSGVVGNILMLLCAFISAIYMIWFKGLLKKYDPLTLLRWMFCITAVVFLPFGLDTLLTVDTAKFTPHVWLAVAYLVVMPTYFPNLLLTSALKRVSPTVSSTYIYVQPTVAVAISIAAGLDTLRFVTVVFASLIFAGVAVVISATAAQHRAE
ncbi:MAG: DMT family transporter [Rikenellaceae bacterium]